MDSVKTARRSLVGRVFGYQTVVRLLGGYQVLVHCGGCGAKVVKDKRNLYKTDSCGCLRAELVSRKLTKHGGAKVGGRTAEYKAWCGMIHRINSKADGDYSYYLKRGITICEHLRHSFPLFLKIMGIKPSSRYSLDRTNNDLGYLCPLCCPPKGNLRWATASQQRLNQRRCQLENTKDIRSELETGIKICPKHLKAVWHDSKTCPACDAERELLHLTNEMAVRDASQGDI